MATRVTEFGIMYDLTDTTALNDAEPHSESNQPFAKLSNLKNIENVPKRMTLEHNYSVLDGTIEEFKNTGYSFFSNSMSNSYGVFKNNPKIDIRFEKYHSSFALTLWFNDVHPHEMLVTWYKDGSILLSRVCKVTSNKYIVDSDVQSYNRIVFEFTKTLPKHYVKLDSVKYGVELIWNDKDIKDASITKDSDIISSKLAVDTLTFTLNDKENKMNFGNILGMHNYFQRKQPMYPYEVVNGTKVNLGKYYLDKVSNTRNIVKLNTVSLLGLLNDTQFIYGDIYDGDLAGDILVKLLKDAGISSYSIDPITYNQKLYGTLKPQSTRSALQKILFACSSIIDTSNDETLTIYKPSLVITNPITRSTKFTTQVERNNYVSGVEIKYNDFKLSEEITEISKGKFDKGVQTIVFHEPYKNIKIVNGTIIEQSTYYVSFKPINPKEDVVITGNSYKSTTNAIIKERKFLEPWKSRNTLSFTTDLCNTETASILADKLLEHYTRDELTIRVKHMANDASLVNLHIIENSAIGMGNYIARFAKRNINLTGGFIDNAELIGYFDTQDSQYFAGTELYASGNGDVIL